MPPNQIEPFFGVVYLVGNIQNCNERVILAPISFIKNNKVYLPEFPHTPDDKDLIKSYLKLKNKPEPPATWIEFDCIVFMDTYGKILYK